MSSTFKLIQVCGNVETFSLGLAFSLEPPRSVISLIPDIHVHGCVSIHSKANGNIRHSRPASQSMAYHASMPCEQESGERSVVPTWNADS